MGATRDDAAGEAFDKIGRMLGIPYPAGPTFEKLALRGDAAAIHFTRAKLKNGAYDYSFSGLKTAARLLTISNLPSGPVRRGLTLENSRKPS